MITFKQFLHEDAISLEDAITTMCQPFLKMPGHDADFLVRGLGSFTPTYKHDGDLQWAIVEARRNRRPIDTPQNFSNAADDLFQEKFGWRPRANGTFLTGDWSAATLYEKEHIIIQIGPTRYIWSPSCSDMYIRLYRPLRDKWNFSVGPLPSPAEQLTEFKAALEKVDYIDTDLAKALKMPHMEIVFDCDRYIAINANGPTHELLPVADLLGITL